ncbi:MAG: macro domain-containing protein [bacterium]
MAQGVDPHLHNLLFSLYHSAKRKREQLFLKDNPTGDEKANATIPQKVLEMLMVRMGPVLNQDEKKLLTNLLKDLGTDTLSVKSKEYLKGLKPYRIVSSVFEGEIRITINKCVLILVMGDLIQMPVDCLVSPDNTKLLLDRGIPSIIRLWGGDKIRQEAQASAPAQIGSVVVTSASELPFKRILHAVIMEPHKETTREAILKAMDEVFKILDDLKLKSVAFPAFGTANIKFPYDICAKVMLQSIIDNIQKRPDSLLETVIISLYNREAYMRFVEQFELLNQTYALKIDKE